MSEAVEKRSVIHLSLGGHVNRDAVYIPAIESQCCEVFINDLNVINTYWVEDYAGTESTAKAVAKAYRETDNYLDAYILKLGPELPMIGRKPNLAEVKMIRDRILSSDFTPSYNQFLKIMVQTLGQMNRFQFQQRAMVDRLKDGFHPRLVLETHSESDVKLIETGIDRGVKANRASRQAIRAGDVPSTIDKGYEAMQAEANVQRKRNPQIANQLVDNVISAHKRKSIARIVVRVGQSHKVLETYLQKIQRHKWDADIRMEFDEGLPEIDIPKNIGLQKLELTGVQPTKDEILYYQVHELLHDSTDPHLPRRESWRLVDAALAPYNTETLPTLVASFRAETYEHQARDLIALAQAA